MNVTTSPASSAFMVIASSLPAHFNILAYMRSKASTTRRASFKNSLLVPPVAVAPRETLPPVATATAALRARKTAHTFPAHISPAHAPPTARSTARTTPRTRAIATTASTANHPHHPIIMHPNTRRATHHIRQIHPHRQRTIASKVCKPIGVQLQRHERDVGRIHGLEFKPIHRVRLKVRIGDEIFDRVEDFFKDGALV